MGNNKIVLEKVLFRFDLFFDSVFYE